MAVVMAVVEAYYVEDGASVEDGVWKHVCRPFTGEEEDVIPKAEAIRDEWLAQGWPKENIRVAKSAFRFFNKKEWNGD